VIAVSIIKLLRMEAKKDQAPKKEEIKTNAKKKDDKAPAEEELVSAIP